MADLGTDIDCVSGIGKVFGLATGRKNLAQAIARRLMTPRGGLFYDPNYGFSLILLLSSGGTKAQIEGQGAAIANEAQKDERVLSCTPQLSYDERTRKLTVDLFLETADGPFTLVLQASALTVEILKVQ